MKSLTQAFRELRRKNIRQYALLAGCCFFSVLLITAYVCMMRSPTVLSVLPEGGDSRKQVMMIFVLAVVGCGVFTTYASGLFFRYKSRESGILMALGMSRRQLSTQLTAELVLLAFASCALGALLGAPLARGIWQFFRMVVVDTQEMALRLDPQAYLFALAFSLFVAVMLLFMLSRFIRRTNIIDIVNQSRKSEPIRGVPRWYGISGIALLIGGFMLGYMVPSFCIQVLRWYPPEGLTAPLYIPAFIGLYMILLHTVVNGWRRGQSHYKNIISTSMMRFQGRQTVRSMLVITVLVAGAYFAAFYTPMLGTGAMMGYDARPIDYAFRYRADADMITEEEIREMARSAGASVTDYCSRPMAVLGIDGNESIETGGALGSTYTVEYRELLKSAPFLSESAYNSLTGERVDVPPGRIAAVFNDEGHSGYVTSDSVTRVTNVVTGDVLTVAPCEDTLRCSMLLGRYVLDDADFAVITGGLSGEWVEEQVFFNAENDSYDFSKALFNAIVDHSSPAAAVYDAWDPIIKMRAEKNGEPYWADNENLVSNGLEALDYSKRDSSDFRMYWKYMPQFRVLDREDFVKTTAVFLMLFIFIAIVCFAAVIVIAHTRSLTIAMTNAQVYDDLRHLGAARGYLYGTVKKQISKVYFTPVATGTVIIYVLYMLIMFFNDGGSFSGSEIAGMGNCLLLVAAMSALMYGIYRVTLRKVCHMLGVKKLAAS